MSEHSEQTAGDAIMAMAADIKMRDDKIERLRELLQEARDDVAECYERETKTHRIIAYRKQLIEIDRALKR